MIPITVSYPGVAAEWHPTRNLIEPESVSAGMTKRYGGYAPKNAQKGVFMSGKPI